MTQLYASLTASLGLAVAVGHSVLGGRSLLGPLYKERRSGGVLERQTARNILRAVWHVPSFAWATLGVAVFLNRRQPNSNALLPATGAAIFGVSGLANIVALGRPHPGGLLLGAMAALTMADIKANSSP